MTGCVSEVEAIIFKILKIFITLNPFFTIYGKYGIYVCLYSAVIIVTVYRLRWMSGGIKAGNNDALEGLKLSVCSKQNSWYKTGWM